MVNQTRPLPRTRAPPADPIQRMAFRAPVRNVTLCDAMMTPAGTGFVQRHGPPLLAIVGATGVGKSALAQAVAERTGATLISVDSRKVYRGLDIGTAKPPPEIVRRFEYGMIDCADPTEPFSAGRFAREASEIISQRRRTGRPIILVGGTGFYLEALIRGLADLPDVDRDLRGAVLAEADAIGWRAMHDRLRSIDPDFAATVHPSDKTRILRGLEIHRQTGEPPSRLLARSARRGLTEPLMVLWIDLPRPALHIRIQQRVDRMVQLGLFREVASLLERGLGTDAPGLATVGYQEAISYLQGRISESETIALIARNTQRYAKRQITWFRHRAYAKRLEIEADAVQRVMAIWAEAERSGL